MNDPEQIKQMLAAPNQKFMDYRSMVEKDPSFGRKSDAGKSLHCLCG